MAPRASLILADAPRVGKTGQALLAARLRCPEAPILVVGPVAAKTTWQDAIASWRPELTFRGMKHNTFEWPTSGEVGFVSYESFPASWDPPPENLILILDEAHKIRNPLSKLSQRIQAIAQRLLKFKDSGAAVWALTGTPIVHRPPDLWTLLETLGLNKETFPTYGEFVHQFDGRIVESRTRDLMGLPIVRVTAVDWGQPSKSVATRLRRVMLRRTLAQVSEHLPKKTVTVMRVELSDDVTRLCDEALLAIQARGMTLAHAFRWANLRDCMSFPEISRCKAAVAASKIPALMHLVENFEAAGEPLVVASDQRSVTDALEARSGWGAITGEVSSARRANLIREFQTGQLKGMALSIRAAATAISLTRATTMVMVDLPWSPGDVEQIQARLDGPDQHLPVEIIHLRSDHEFERRLSQLVAVKERVIRQSVGMV